MTRTTTTPALPEPLHAEPKPEARPPRPVDETWRPDLLDGFERRDIPVGAEPLEGEPEDAVVATLVRRSDRALHDLPRAVIYVHGWNDYFFQRHLAEFFEAQGTAFYAVDLRRCGRSLQPGQFSGYVDHMHDYFVELDAAYALLEGHESVLAMGHSTGGLVVSLWASERPGRLSGLVLNSPWLDLYGPPVVAAVLKPALSTWNRRNPTSIIPVPEVGVGIYARAIHRDRGGEWDYDLDIKSPMPQPIRVGWLRAILHAHADVAHGLGVDCPVFVATSDQTVFLTRWSKRALEADIVLEVDKIAAASWHLGDHVTLVRIHHGLHDLTLSRPVPRGQFFGYLEAWLGAYPVAASPRARLTSAEGLR